LSSRIQEEVGAEYWRERMRCDEEEVVEDESVKEGEDEEAKLCWTVIER
jgi:hypothetical protein